VIRVSKNYPTIVQQQEGISGMNPFCASLSLFAASLIAE